MSRSAEDLVDDGSNFRRIASVERGQTKSRLVPDIHNIDSRRFETGLDILIRDREKVITKNSLLYRKSVGSFPLLQKIS